MAHPHNILWKCMVLINTPPEKTMHFHFPFDFLVIFLFYFPFPYLFYLLFYLIRWREYVAFLNDWTVNILSAITLLSASILFLWIFYFCEYFSLMGSSLYEHFSSICTFPSWVRFLHVCFSYINIFFIIKQLIMVKRIFYYFHSF